MLEFSPFTGTSKSPLNMFSTSRINALRCGPEQLWGQAATTASRLLFFSHDYQGLERLQFSLTCRQGDFAGGILQKKEYRTKASEDRLTDRCRHSRNPYKKSAASKLGSLLAQAELVGLIMQSGERGKYWALEKWRLPAPSQKLKAGIFPGLGASSCPRIF